MSPDTDAPCRRTARYRRGVGARTPATPTPIPDPGLGVASFVESLLNMSRSGLERQAAALRARRASPDDDVAWWKATMALDRSVRTRGIWHEADVAAQLASRAVLAAATRTGLAVGSEVTVLARGAADVARLLVAGELDTTGAAYLARGWEDLLQPTKGQR